MGAVALPGSPGAAHVNGDHRVRILHPGASVWAPYRAAHRLAGWAAANRDYVEGRLLLAGRQTYAGATATAAAVTLREYLQAAYAIQIDQITLVVAAAQGNLYEALQRFEESLTEPLPGELSAKQIEMRRRNRIAEQNASALQALMSVTAMPMPGERRG